MLFIRNIPNFTIIVALYRLKNKTGNNNVTFIMDIIEKILNKP